VAARSSPFARLREPQAITATAREAAREVLEQLRAEAEEDQARLEEREAVQRATRVPLLEWTREIPTPQHGPLRFGDFPFQVEFYGTRATHDRELAVRKCTQAGFSEWAIRVALFHADRGRTAMYVMPDDAHLKDFSNMRIKPVLRASPYLQGRILDDAVDNVGLKQIGLGWVAFRGARSPTALMSVPADALILDEYDQLQPENLGEAEQRVTGPLSAGIIRRLGVPTLPGWGIDRIWSDGDQCAWTVRCGECEEWNRLEGSEGWQANVDQTRAIVVCRRCREPLDVRRNGEWVPRHPERSVRTYTIPKYAIYGVNIADIVARSKRTRPIDVEKFHRNDLGEPYTPADARLSREAILACVRRELVVLEGLTSARLVTLGADAKGRGTLHVTIREHLDEFRRRMVWVGTVDSFTRLGELMDLYGVNMAAVDRAPEWQQAHAFCNRFPGRAYAVGFLTGKHARNIAKLDVPMIVKDDERSASVRRVQAIDTMLAEYRRQWVLLPPLEALPDEFPRHLQALVRVVEEHPDETGRKQVFYRSIGPDDFALADVYNVMAAELWFRQAGIEAVQFEAEHPQPHDDAIEYTRARLAEGDADEYREGFGGVDDFGPDLG
jgi:phage terminase large subunit GpA